MSDTGLDARTGEFAREVPLVGATMHDEAITRMALARAVLAFAQSERDAVHAELWGRVEAAETDAVYWKERFRGTWPTDKERIDEATVDECEAMIAFALEWFEISSERLRREFRRDARARAEKGQDDE